MAVPLTGFVARRSYLPAGRPSNLNCPEPSVRLVAQERGVPCQVRVTIALRTGSLFEASTTLPEMTAVPGAWAKAIAEKMALAQITRMKAGAFCGISMLYA